MRVAYHTIYIFLCCFLWVTPLFSESSSTDEVQNIIDSSTITRFQKPLAVRTDRNTLEYFIEHVEELTKHGKDFSRGELILEVKGDSTYDIQIPSKHITGDFKLAKLQSNKAVYLGHGNADKFFNFTGSIVLEVDYTTQNDESGCYEDIKTAVYLKFDNAFLAVLAKVASPILNPQLDKLISKFSKKTKKVIEAAYADKKGKAKR